MNAFYMIADEQNKKKNTTKSFEYRGKKKKDCPEKLVIGSSSRWKGWFDLYILLLVAYSTFTSAYLYPNIFNI
jgi:hypothetical protein